MAPGKLLLPKKQAISGQIAGTLSTEHSSKQWHAIPLPPVDHLAQKHKRVLESSLSGNEKYLEVHHDDRNYATKMCVLRLSNAHTVIVASIAWDC